MVVVVAQKLLSNKKMSLSSHIDGIWAVSGGKYLWKRYIWSICKGVLMINKWDGLVDVKWGESGGDSLVEGWQSETAEIRWCTWMQFVIFKAQPLGGCTRAMKVAKYSKRGSTCNIDTLHAAHYWTSRAHSQQLIQFVYSHAALQHKVIT